MNPPSSPMEGPLSMRQWEATSAQNRCRTGRRDDTSAGALDSAASPSSSFWSCSSRSCPGTAAPSHHLSRDDDAERPSATPLDTSPTSRYSPSCHVQGLSSTSGPCSAEPSHHRHRSIPSILLPLPQHGLPGRTWQIPPWQAPGGGGAGRGVLGEVLGSHWEVPAGSPGSFSVPCGVTRGRACARRSACHSAGAAHAHAPLLGLLLLVLAVLGRGAHASSAFRASAWGRPRGAGRGPHRVGASWRNHRSLVKRKADLPLVHVSQQAALLALRQSFPLPAVTTTWNTTQACARWTGITCDSNGYVTSISLSLASLDQPGSIPSQIGSLTKLSALQLTGGGITGSFPPAFSSLTGLQLLDLTGSGVGGALSLLPLQRLTKLTTLALNFNSLSGDIPSSLASCKSLQHLLLGSNRLSGTVTNVFGSLRSLEALDLSSNSLYGVLPGAITSSPALFFFDVSNNQLSGGIPTRFVSAYMGTPNATYRIHGNYFSGTPVPLYDSTRPFCPLLLEGGYAIANLLDYRCAVFSSEASNCFVTTTTDPWSAYNNALSSSQSGGSWVHGTSASDDSREALRRLYSKKQLQGMLSGPWGRGRRRGFSGRYADGGGSSALNGSCYLEPQKVPQLCAAFCNALDSKGPCGGLGSCFVSSSSNFAPACACSSQAWPTYFNSFGASGMDAVTKAAVPGFPSCTANRTLVYPGPTLIFTRPSGNFTGGLSLDPYPSSQDVAVTRATLLTRRHLQASNISAPDRLNRNFRHLSTGFQGSYASPAWSIKNATDWRVPLGPSKASAVQGIKDQGSCALCWAFAAVGALESALAISSSTYAPDISEQQLLDCQGTWDCTGGVPADALNFLSSAAPGVVGEQGYPYRAMQGACNSTVIAASSTLYSSVMYEQSGSSGWFSILLAVQGQPAVADLEADQLSFLTFAGGYVYNDPDCFANQVITHSVLVVGYDLTAPVPFWILKNSWGTNWGEQGYMRLAVQGGAGVCGINISPPRYPVARGSNPCAAPNPCGGGMCTVASNGSNICSKCPPNFMPVANLDGSQSCAPILVCSLFDSNPCGVGTCVDDKAGGYNCLCPPPGYTNGILSNGAPTCVPGNASDALIVQPGMTCDLIRVTYGLSSSAFASANPAVNCNNLTTGTLLNVSNPGYQGCQLYYTVAPNDTCSSIASVFSANLSAANPDLNCSKLSLGQQVCVQPGAPQVYLCTQLYSVTSGDSCSSIALTKANPPLTPQQFYAYNPGIICANLVPSTTTSSSTSMAIYSSVFGTQVCLAASAVNITSFVTGAVKCAYGPYIVVRGDSCARLYVRFWCGKPPLFIKYAKFACTPNALYAGRLLCKAPKTCV